MNFCARAGKLLQHIVARRVAALVVDLLEMIEIAHEHRQGIRIAAAALELARQLLHQVAAIVGAGQRIGDRQDAVALIGDAQRMFERQNSPSGIQARDQLRPRAPV